MRSSRRYQFPPAALAVAALAVATFASGALAAEDAVFKAGVEVVNILATVRDGSGQLVSNLDKEDFSLEENGDPQTIRYFSRQSDLPLTIGLLVDTSLSQRRIIDEEKSASRLFFNQVIDESKDQAFVIRFDTEVELLQDLTSSKKLLHAALGGLRTPPGETRLWLTGNNQFPGGGQWPGGNWPGQRRRRGGPRDPGMGHGAIGTALYDAIFLAADEVLKPETVRKAMIVISDGVDLGSKLPAEEAINAAQRSGVVVYGVYYADPNLQGRRAGTSFPGPGGRNGESALREIAEPTGGRLFKVSGETTLAQIYGQIQAELRNQYNIGYSPRHEKPVKGFRRIELKAKGTGLQVTTRAGYYPREAEAADGVGYTEKH